MLLVAREVNDWLKDMSWLSKRDKLDPVQSSAIDFVAAQKGNFYVSGEAGMGRPVVLASIRMI